MSWIITGTEKNDPVGIENVSLLLHGDGANGSTTIIDSSPSSKTITVVGDTQISTAQSKFGGSSIAFDGSGDYLTTIGGSAFAMGAGDFTWEAWIYINPGVGYRQIFSSRDNQSTNAAAGSLAVNPSGGLTWFTSTFIVNYTVSIGVTQWIHVAISRQGTSLKVFANGVEVGAATNSDNLTNAVFTVGANANGSELFNGYIDDLRVTKGVARYTSNFTPPTAPFPDF